MGKHHKGHANSNGLALCYGGSMQGGWGGKFGGGEINIQSVEMPTPRDEVLKPSITLKANLRSHQWFSKRTIEFKWKSEKKRLPFHKVE
jgi:hypothetical protein